jgi:hypothetical protein
MEFSHKPLGKRGGLVQAQQHGEISLGELIVRHLPGENVGFQTLPVGIPSIVFKLGVSEASLSTHAVI